MRLSFISCLSFFFFFSSRRRHTRFDCDWSSDVCSSDLLNVDVTREIEYYAKQSTNMTALITILGGFVAAIMAIGAVFGALNTMYSAVAERGREIATMRALGFNSGNVVL